MKRTVVAALLLPLLGATYIPPRGRVPAPPRRPRRVDWRVLAGFAAVAIALFLLFRPSPAVKNLDSRNAAIVAFGDSLTAGYGAGEGEDFPAVLASRAGVAIVNAGVSGDTTESALHRLESDVLARSPRLVIVGLGGNDFLQSVPIATTEANLRNIVQRIQGAGGMVLLLGFRFPSLSANYGKMYERIAEEERCLLVPDLMDGILSDNSLKSDEIHPNAKGYALMAERIEGPLKKLLARADAAR
jgi:acyl-CoA thioesterase-1